MNRKILSLALLALALVALAVPLLGAPDKDNDKEWERIIREAAEKGELQKMIPTGPVPVIAVTLIFLPGPLTVILLFFYFRWRHQQRMLMIEKGTLDDKPVNFRVHSLLWGMICALAGLAITAIGLVNVGKLNGGIVVFGIGAALLGYHFITSADHHIELGERKSKSNREQLDYYADLAAKDKAAKATRRAARKQD